MLDINWNTKFLELITPTRFVIFLTLVLCCWTSPRYYDGRIARLCRVPVGILSATWWLCYPYVFVVTPLETNFRTNIGHFAFSYILLAKTLDWAIFSGPQSRRKFVMKNSDTPGGNWEVAERQGTTTLDEFNALWSHILFQCTSMRGLQYPWGHFSEINRNSLKHDFLRFVIFQVYSLIVVGSLVNRENLGSGITVEQESKNLEMNLIFYVLEHWKNTVIIITGLCATFEAFESFLAVLAHLLHPRLIHFGFPDEICEFFNPVYYPSLFGNPLKTNSLSEFWGKIWHQVLRRSFIVLGAFPVAGLSVALGINPKYQRIMGFIGAFIASGFLHAGPFWLMSDTSSSTGKISGLEKLGIFICFLSQAFGSLIEEKVARLIPKRLGGGRLWTIGFILCTLPVFSHAATKPGRFISIFDPVQQWGFFHFVTPIVISPFFSSISS